MAGVYCTAPFPAGNAGSDSPLRGDPPDARVGEYWRGAPDAVAEPSIGLRCGESERGDLIGS